MTFGINAYTYNGRHLQRVGVKSVLFKLSIALVCVFGLALPVLAHGVILKADPPLGGALATAPTSTPVAR